MVGLMVTTVGLMAIVIDSKANMVVLIIKLKGSMVKTVASTDPMVGLRGQIVVGMVWLIEIVDLVVPLVLLVAKALEMGSIVV